MSARIVTLALAVFSIAFAIPFAARFGEIIPILPSLNWFMPFALGAVFGGFLGAVIFIKLPMVAILEHELTHLCVALCLLRKPIRIVADPQGGETVYEGRGSVLIRLAPYVLPTVTILFMAVLELLHIERSWHTVFALSASWGYHIMTGIMESNPRQSDLRRGGLIASYGAVIALCTLIYPITGLFIMNEWSLVRNCFENSWFDALSVLGISD